MKRRTHYIKTDGQLSTNISLRYELTRLIDISDTLNLATARDWLKELLEVTDENKRYDDESWIKEATKKNS